MDPVTKRELAWLQQGELINVCDMLNEDLIHAVHSLRQKIILTKLATGKTSLSKLALNYMIDELKERGYEYEKL